MYMIILEWFHWKRVKVHCIRNVISLLASGQLVKQAECRMLAKKGREGTVNVGNGTADDDKNKKRPNSYVNAQ